MPQPAFRFPPFGYGARSGQGNMLFRIRRCLFVFRQESPVLNVVFRAKNTRCDFTGLLLQGTVPEVVRRLPVSHTRPVAIPEFRRHLGEELPMSETMQPVVGYRCGVPVFRDIQQRCEIVIA